MDTSKKYIEMCQKAEEIQEEWKPKRGDFYTVVVHGKATDITNIYIDGFPSLPQRFIPLSELYVWLPRQDQLQEMVDGKWMRMLVALYDYAFKEATNICGDCFNEQGRFADGEKFYEACIDEILKRWVSMEQLWLAFVMKEKYNKTWNGKEWIK